MTTVVHSRKFTKLHPQKYVQRKYHSSTSVRHRYHLLLSWFISNRTFIHYFQPILLLNVRNWFSLLMTFLIHQHSSFNFTKSKFKLTWKFSEYNQTRDWLIASYIVLFVDHVRPFHLILQNNLFILHFRSRLTNGLEPI